MIRNLCGFCGGNERKPQSRFCSIDCAEAMDRANDEAAYLRKFSRRSEIVAVFVAGLLIGALALAIVSCGA